MRTLPNPSYPNVKYRPTMALTIVVTDLYE